MAFSFALTIGNGNNTSFPDVHALHTKDIGYEVHDIATGGFVAVDAAIDSIDQITVGPFITPPTTNQYRVFVWSIGGDVTVGVPIGTPVELVEAPESNVVTNDNVLIVQEEDSLELIEAEAPVTVIEDDIP